MMTKSDLAPGERNEHIDRCYRQLKWSTISLVGTIGWQLMSSSPRKCATYGRVIGHET